MSSTQGAPPCSITFAASLPVTMPMANPSLNWMKALRFWFIKWRMGLQLALFGDVGTAWYDGPEFSENFIAGFGGGLRLTIPVVVLLRIDVAYAKDQFGLKIAIGGAEKAIAQKQRVR